MIHMMRTTCFSTGQVDWGQLISRQSYMQVSKGTKLFFSEALWAIATSLGRESQKGFQSRWLGKSSGLMQPEGVVYFWGSTLVSGGEGLKYGGCGTVNLPIMETGWQLIGLCNDFASIWLLVSERLLSHQTSFMHYCQL